MPTFQLLDIQRTQNWFSLVFPKKKDSKLENFVKYCRTDPDCNLRLFLKKCWEHAELMEKNKIHLLMPWDPHCWFIANDTDIVYWPLHQMSFPNGHLNMQDKVHHTPGLGLDAGPNKDDPRDIFLRSKGKLHPIWLVVLASACVMHTQKDRYDNWIIKNAFTAKTRPLNLHTSEIANLGLQGSQRKIVIENVL